MKRIVLMILLAITICNCFAQNFNKITLNGNDVSVEGDKLLPVKGKQQVWDVNFEYEQEVFQLISENTSKVNYKLNGKFVNAVPGGDMDTIPYKKGNNKHFYNTARLVLKRDSLPITISVNGHVVAIFQLKNKYQKFEIPQKNVFYVGDTLRIIKDNSNESIPIQKVSFKIKVGNNTFDIKDSIIPEELLGSNDSINKCQIICIVEYKGGKNVSEKTLDNIKIERKNNEDKMTYIISFITILLVIALCGIYFWKRKNAENESVLLKKEEEQNIDKYNGNESSQIDSSAKNNPLEPYQVDHTSASNDTGSDVLTNESVNQINTQNPQIAEIESLQGTADFSELRDRITELEKSEEDKLAEIEQLLSEKRNIVAEKANLQARLSEITSDNVSKKELRNKIEELKGEKNKLIREKQNKERELVDARKSITNLESKIKEKEDKITEINRQKDEAESNLRIEKNSTAVLQKKISSFSKQTYYLYAIDDAMQAVDSSLKHLFTDVCDENLMKRLAQPVLSGTAGLDLGLESYLNEWKSSVYDNQNQFFGDDVLNMTDDSVKEKLAEFLEQLALRDSFGKLVRLYTMTNVGWINEQMVKTGFNVDAIQTIFARFKNLLALFNIAISYPRLFVDKFDPNRHKDNMRCEIFNYFEPSVELLAQLKTRENENLIVDVTRIGIPNSKIPARRNAMVSLPNF